MTKTAPYSYSPPKSGPTTNDVTDGMTLPWLRRLSKAASLPSAEMPGFGGERVAW